MHGYGISSTLVKNRINCSRGINVKRYLNEKPTHKGHTKNVLRLINFLYMYKTI